MCWADGVISDAEAESMRRIIASAPLDAHARAQMLGWLEAPIELDLAAYAALEEGARAGIYAAAAELALLDDEVVDEERSFLKRLREGLEIDAELAAVIEARLAPEASS